MTDIPLPTKAAEFIRENAAKYAEAKANRVYLEQFRKSKKALLMQECEDRTAAMKEVYAYAHPDYITVLEGIKAAVEIEETLRWKMTSADLHIQIWRTQSSNNRRTDGAHQ